MQRRRTRATANTAPANGNGSNGNGHTHGTHPLMMSVPFDPPPSEMPPLATLVYLHSLSEGQRNRDFQMTQTLLQMTMQASQQHAAQMIESERARSESFVAMVQQQQQATQKESRELRETVRTLRDEIEDLKAEREDIQTQALEQHIASLAERPEQAESVAQSIGALLGTPAGQALFDSLKNFITGAPAPRPPGVAWDGDPAG